jgi:hypothetical protein
MSPWGKLKKSWETAKAKRVRFAVGDIVNYREGAVFDKTGALVMKFGGVVTSKPDPRFGIVGVDFHDGYRGSYMPEALEKAK